MIPIESVRLELFIGLFLGITFGYMHSGGRGSSPHSDSDNTMSTQMPTAPLLEVTPSAPSIPTPAGPLPTSKIPNSESVCGLPDDSWSCAQYPERCAFVYLGMVFKKDLGTMQPGKASKFLWLSYYAATKLRKLHPKNPIVIVTNIENIESRFGTFPFPFTDVVYDTREFIAKPNHFTVAMKYPRNLFLDSDTIATGDMTPAFDALRYYDLALAPENGWHQGIAPMLYYKVLYNADNMMPQYPGVPRSNLPFAMWHHYEVQYNTGLVAYRGSGTPSYGCVKGFMEKWHQIHVSTHCKGMDVVWDQCSLPLAIRDYAIRVGTLSEAFNYRKAIGMVCTQQPMEGIRLWHDKKADMMKAVNEQYGQSFK